ncbi:MAG: hypothetical protein MHM6MM_005193 [Cercozoa sp. M6MM]
MQMQAAQADSTTKYRSMPHAMKQIVRQEGPLALYRGLAPNLAGSAMSWSVYFFLYRSVKQLFRSQSDSARLSPMQHLLSGYAAGVGTSLITNPIWVVKTLVQTSNDRNASVASCVRRTLQTDGIGGFYRGIRPALLIAWNSGIQFMAYEQLKRVVFRHVNAGEDLREWQWAMMAATSKMFSVTITYPLQVMRTVLYGGEVSSVTDACRHIAKGGPRAFYRGLVPQLCKTAPSAALNLMFYEMACLYLGVLDEDHKLQ